MKRSDLRLQLGLTQQEMAMLLGMTRSMYSMYELGKRDLPLMTSALHGQIAVIASRLQKPSKAQKKNSEAQKEIQKHVQKLQRENEYERLTVERRIALLQKQQQSESARAALLEWLQSESAKGDVPIPKVNLRAPKSQNASKRARELLTLEIKLQMLEYEKTLLENKS